jgi:NAD(P)H-hydrate epimerase
MLVDASALAWLRSGATPANAVRIITPHPGEAARLLGSSADQIQSDRVGSLRRLSAKFGDCHVVLKGHQTLIGRSSGPVWVNSSGNPHLAQGGSGDVLSGYIGGLLAQPCLDPELALRFAVWQHGATADFLQQQRPNWVVEDLVEALGNSGEPARNHR